MAVGFWTSNGGLKSEVTDIVAQVNTFYDVRVIADDNEGWIYVDNVLRLYTNALTQYQSGGFALRPYAQTEYQNIDIQPINPTMPPTTNPSMEPTAEPTINADSLCTESDWTGDTQSFTFTPANNCSISSNGILSWTKTIDSTRTVDNFEINFRVRFGDLSYPSAFTANQFRKQDTWNFYNAAIYAAKNTGYLTVGFWNNNGVIDFAVCLDIVAQVNTFYNVRVIAVDNEGWIYVDNVLRLYSNALTEWQSGGFALKPYVQTEYQNIDIQPINPTMQPTTNPSMEPTAEPTIEPTPFSSPWCPQSAWSGDLQLFSFETQQCEMQSLNAATIYTLDQFVNFEMTFRLRFSYSDSAIRFRADPSMSTGYYRLSVQGYPNMFLDFGRRNSDGSYTTLKNTYPGITVSEDTWFDFKLIVNGNEGWLFVNGVQYLYANSFYDESIGSIGLNANYQTRWKNIDIVAITSSPTAPSIHPTGNPSMEPTVLSQTTSDIVVTETTDDDIEDNSGAESDVKWIMSMFCAILFVFAQ